MIRATELSGPESAKAFKLRRPARPTGRATFFGPITPSREWRRPRCRDRRLVPSGRVFSLALLTLLLAVSSPDRSPLPDRRAVGEPPRVEPVQSRAAPEPKRVENVKQRIRRRGAASVGYATYYARMFQGRMTASGVRFDSNALVAAHPSYPFGTLLHVTNLRNGSSTRVRIVDRGPARGPRRNGVIIDLSRAAAKSLGMIRAGRTRVRLEVVPSE